LQKLHVRRPDVCNAGICALLPVVFTVSVFLLFLSAGGRFQWGSSALRFYLLPLLP
jgi:hypothetical protein